MAAYSFDGVGTKIIDVSGNQRHLEFDGDRTDGILRGALWIDNTVIKSTGRINIQNLLPFLCD